MQKKEKIQPIKKVPESYNVLTLDPGASTGFCITSLDFKTSTATIIEYGYLNVDTSSNFQGDHCIDLMERVRSIIEKHYIKELAIEDYFFSKRFATGCNVNGAYRTAIHILARTASLPYTILNITSWKTFVAGRSTPTREQKKQWGATAAKKLYIQQALWDNFGIRFPNHSLSEKTGKPIVFRTDIVDVVAQTIYFCQMIKKMTRIENKVSIPPDVKLRVTGKKSKNFVYC